MIVQLLLNEFDREIASTRTILERVPFEKADWKPHAKSMTLGRLASHIAELSQFLTAAILLDEIDMAARPFDPRTCNSSEELFEFLEQKAAEARAALLDANDETLMEKWVLRMGSHIIFEGSRYAAIRYLMANHMVHHRGQLSVYLRLLDIPLPGLYGPSADDRAAMAQAAALQN